jgi:hypothetical protein
MIAEPEVPPAAQRLRNPGAWLHARMIAEPEVPPAAQALRKSRRLTAAQITGAVNRDALGVARTS